MIIMIIILGILQSGFSLCFLQMEDFAVAASVHYFASLGNSKHNLFQWAIHTLVD